MASGFLFIDGRDPDSVFSAGNAGITTGLKHASSGTDLGNLYISGNSGITTGLLSETGADIGSLFGTSVPALPFNGTTFTSEPTFAGGISTAILNFITNNATYSITGSHENTSGSVSSGAAFAKVTVTYVSGSTSTIITNPMSALTALSGTSQAMNLHLTAPQTSPISATYSVLVQYYNSAETLISSTSCTFFMDTAAS
jgi:hypothetical protein